MFKFKTLVQNTKVSSLKKLLSFFDIKTIGENKKLTTSVYRYPVFSGAFNNLGSFASAINLKFIDHF